MSPRAASPWLVQQLSTGSLCQLYRALDAVHTAQHRPARKTRALLLEAFRRSTSRYDRIGALTQWVEAAAPELVARVRRHLQRVDGLPLRVDAVTPLAFGKGSSCFLLEGTPPLVLKVLRRSLGQDAHTLAMLACGMRDDYWTLQRWYEDVPGLFPRTMHLVLHSPLRGIGAAVRIQEFVEGQVKDLFRDFTDEELIDLMSRTPCFARRVRAFAGATRRAWDSEGRVLDMVGRDNVMFVERSSGPDLCVADLGITDLEAKRRQAPKVYAHASRILERLERLAREG